MDSFSDRLFSQLQRTTLLEQVVGQCGVVVMATDLNGEVLMVDGGMLRDAGENPSDMIGKNVSSIVARPRRWSEGLVAVTNGSRRVSFLVDYDGVKRLETFGPLLSPAGRVVGVLSITAKVEYGS